MKDLCFLDINWLNLSLKLAKCTAMVLNIIWFEQCLIILRLFP